MMGEEDILNGVMGPATPAPGPAEPGQEPDGDEAPREDPQELLAQLQSIIEQLQAALA